MAVIWHRNLEKNGVAVRQGGHVFQQSTCQEGKINAVMKSNVRFNFDKIM